MGLPIYPFLRGYGEHSQPLRIWCDKNNHPAHLLIKLILLNKSTLRKILFSIVNKHNQTNDQLINRIKCIPAKKAFLSEGLDFGEPCRDRTDNLLIKSQLLYQLS